MRSIDGHLYSSECLRLNSISSESHVATSCVAVMQPSGTFMRVPVEKRKCPVSLVPLEQLAFASLTFSLVLHWWLRIKCENITF